MTVKRAFDLLIASIVCVVAVPVAAIAAAALRFGSKGPVLFKQDRVTRGGRVFEMYKFRTMVTNGDNEHDIDTSTPFFKMQEDPRVTRIGRILRRTSLDELPQLINVLRGDMSLVGPRPLPADQVAANLDLLDARHEVPAGVTGWWQISGRSSIGPEEAVRMDLFYIENWSLSLDVYVLLKTVGVLATRKGAL
jgi:lipopolysaccharide/colanic/teichoic acid biosynthesis glycosyltransferase